MCGIAGALSLDGSPVGRHPVEAMVEALAHRGPDEGAVVLPGEAPGAASGMVALGHRRLRVIDLSPAAAQPMGDPHGRGWITYNGEIYNAGELRVDLERRGVRFRSRSDTEVALMAMITWGPAALERFNGMFALAFWDGAARRLTLARDRFGEKPLYYAVVEGRLLFASELDALVRHGGVPTDIDPHALELYLTFGFIPSPWSIYRAALKLPHACRLDARPPGAPAAPVRYYRLEDRLDGAAPERPPEAVRDALAGAVRRRLDADVPLGAFLSGGIDSAAVVAFMRRSLARPPLTYSMAIRGAGYFDESARARAVARAEGTVHHEIPVDADRLQAEIPAALDAFGEPFADSSAIASSIVAREARARLTVALSGDGGDEVFGGYRLYRALAAMRLLAPAGGPLRRALRLLLRPLPSRHGGGAAGIVQKARKLADGLSADLAGSHAAWMSICSAQARRALRPGLSDEGLGRHLIEQRYRRFGGGLERTLAVEIDLPLPDDMLAKVDRTSMRHGLEVRAPFLDPQVVEMALALPPAAHFSILSGKRLLRRALRGVVPGAVLRAPKRGFEVPVGDWLAGPLAGMFEEVVSPRLLADVAGVEPRVLRSWVAEHRSRRADHGRTLWALFALCAWYRGARSRAARGDAPTVRAGVAG